MPVVANVPAPPPTPGEVTQQQAPASSTPESGDSVGAILAAAVDQVARIVKPEAAVVVAATFGFPLGLNFAVFLFLAVQGRIDSRDPKLGITAQAATETVTPFQDEEQL
ncbi:MAG: hypothetical protein M3P32_09670 [Chloroflexota bacterium]|nr:hypothetical protein [Chloroflexota bacterium]